MEGETMEKKQNQWLLPAIIVAVLVVALIGFVWRKDKTQEVAEKTEKKVTIGIVTDLTGPGSYWGQSTQVGAEMAKKDLKAEGYDVELIYEDYQLDSAKALTSAKKLVEVDKVDGLYAEFNPATYSITPYLKSLNDSNILFIYDAAPTSPLKELPNSFKSYFDYEVGCAKLAQKYKSEGINKMGMLKIEMEFGESCEAGIKKVYGNELITEKYGFGEKDMKTQVLKLKEAGVGAIMNVSFEGDTLTALKALKDNNFNVPYGAVVDSVNVDVKNAYPEKIKDITIFGFKDITPDFSARIKQAAGDKTLSTEYGAAVAYLHITQMVKAISEGNGDIKVIASKVANAGKSDILGFGGFKNRQADFELVIGPVK